ncbi:MAG: class I SAM-dependent RNA methyltransferase [Clostridia bacterium]|nr:class I SAM-dependent RNA methyltransferase [Clostridia bacterium]
MQFVATCLFGLEKLLGEEIDALGCRRIETMDGRITFEGEASDAASANINLRCAEHVFVKIGSYAATTFTELFDGANALPWEDYIEKDAAFPVKGHSIKSTLFSVPDCQSILKKAIAKRLGSKYGIEKLPESGTKYQIEFFLFKDTVTLMIDTSGVPLHKRGYRPASGAAPLRETLAAALVLTARPREDVLIWDPFCGSGTIAIEAAMIMTGRAPGLFRSFDGENFKFLPKSSWQKAREDARNRINTDSKYEVWASDIDPDVLTFARDNARRAGVENIVKIFEADARKIEKPDRRGSIVCNPPYGERLMTPRETNELYRAMGKCFSHFDPWQIYVLTSSEEFERLYGRRADKKRKLYNGMIPCNLYQFFKPKNDKTK